MKAATENLQADQAAIGPPSERAGAFLPEHYNPIATMRAIAPTICAILGADLPQNADEEPIPDVVANLAGSERIAHIVIDAYGVATWKCHDNVSRTINSLAAIRMVEMQSVLPAITPVNFSTIASGSSPDHHTIRKREETLTVDTSFARLNAMGKTTAVCGRELSTTGILLAHLSAFPSRAPSNSDKEVMDLFAERAEEGVDYILAQLLDVDEAGHEDGPFDLKSHQAVGRTDFRIANMVAAAARNGYGLILHADHGQHDVELADGAPVGMKGTHSGLRQEDVRVPLVYLNNAELQRLLEG